MGMIGASPPRKEDHRLLTGGGSFVDDLRPDGVRYMVVVRSPHPRAVIEAIDRQGLSAHPDTEVFTFQDLPELARPVPLFKEPASNPYCKFMASTPQYALADGEVRHVGEPVAVVLASTPQAAADAAEALQVQYRELPPVLDPELAASGGPRVHAGIENVVSHLQAGFGDIAAAFRAADVVVEERFHYPRISSMPIEVRGVCADFHAATGQLTVWAGHQIPYGLRSAVAEFTGLAEDNVRVICGDTGGAFGPKSPVYPEDLIVPVLAHRTGKPVKWFQTRSDFMLSSQQARDQVLHARLAARSDGTLLGLDVRLVKDVGAYLCWAVIEPTNTINHLVSQYRIPAFRAEAHAVLTNKVPSSPYRGTGRPEASFVTERMLDLLARQLGKAPEDLREQNIVGATEMPHYPGMVYRDGAPVVYDTGDFPKAFKAARNLLDVGHWREEQARHRAAGRRIGIGFAVFMEASGIGWPCEGASVKVDEGGGVEVIVGVSSSGQGHETVFAQVCAESLGVPYDRIRVRNGDTGLFPYGFGTGGSRITVNTGNAVALAAEEVRLRAQIVAANLFECNAADIEIRDGTASITGVPGKSLPLAQVARAALRDRSLAERGGPGLYALKYYYPPTVTWSSGVHAVAVEVDPETATWKILRYAVVHDCGRQLNPQLVEGQVMGGLAQGLGVALGEEIVYSEEGQILTGSMMDYVMPRADNLPDIRMEHFEFQSTLNPLGVRGVGEGNTGAPAPAIANAICDAFEGRVAIRCPMMGPQRLFELLREFR